ncbi:RNA polymerase subunit sigma-24 [Caloranaerobacter azorensis H53214]|uniref:RNA polymerase subunit sigma-24 n=1 Tax=Caloranaerobacter azorensis H53214 TaxID=1156417 RepID=A0A096CXA9_9FIRM|nr:sigma-70 family RNA polymerase sigma factor [Caloranaerobacter azorensis]KGG81209.1 RNA polymerase subunit sigma-24 [Caloranaerobacter azorensis H53214]
MKKSEHILIKKSSEGDVDAFEELIKDYEKRAYNIAYRLLKNSEDAMDVVQEAFIKIYKSIREFKFKSSFSTWVYRIVVNTSIDFMRSKKVVYSLNEVIKSERGDINIEIADYENTPEIELEKKLTKELVKKSIDKLDDIHRTVIILRDIQGFSYNEISEILGCSLGTVKSRISRGRIALREIILKEMEHKDIKLSQKE